MAKKNKAPTPVEQAVGILKDETYQTMVGSNLGQDVALYGTLGRDAVRQGYREVMNSDEVREIKDNDYQERLARGERNGIVGEPTPLTNYDVASNIAEMQAQSRRTINLGKLEEVVRGVAGDGFGFKVPAELRSFSFTQLAEKIAGKKNLTKKEQEAFETFQLLEQEYNNSIAYNAIQTGRSTQLKAVGDELAEKYGRKKASKK